MMVGDHLLDVRTTSAYLALACVHEHFLDIDLIPVVSEDFVGSMKTTEEFHDLADLYLPAVCTLLLSVRFESLPYVFGS